MREPAPAQNESAKPTKAVRPRRLYAGCIVALAVFVIGAMLWRTPIAGYRATAELIYRPAAAESAGPDNESVDAPLNVDQIAEQIRLDETIHRALTAAFAPKVSDDETAPTIDDAQVAAISDYLTVERLSGDTAETHRISISYVDQESDAAVQFVNAVADAFVERCHPEGAEASDELTGELDAARAQTRSAREQLAAATDRRSAMIPIEPQTTEQETPQPEENTMFPAPTARFPAPTAMNPAPTDAPPIEHPLNPDWVQLRDHVTQLTDRQTALSTTRTAVHPEMQQLATEINEFAAILERTPKYLNRQSIASGPVDSFGGPVIEQLAASPMPTLPAISPETSSDDAGWDIPGPTTDANDGDLNETTQAQVAVLDREVEAAQAEVTRLEEHEELLYNQIQLAAQPRATVDVRAVLARRVGGGITQAGLLQLLGIALLVGLIVAVATPVSKADRILRRSADAERQLGVPVIGAISSDENTTSPAPARPVRRIAARAVTAAAELALIAVVVVFLVTLLMDRSLAATCFSDPLHGFNEALEATKQRLVGG